MATPFISFGQYDATWSPRPDLGAGRQHRWAWGENRRTALFADPGTGEIHDPAGVRKIPDQRQPLISKGFATVHMPQKVERLNAAYTLLAQGATASEAVTRLSQRFGLSQRQSYRYVQDVRAIGQPAEPTEELIPITIKIPGTLAETLRTHARTSGHSIGEIVARALRRFLSDADRHG